MAAGLPIACISCPWKASHHPDPAGTQLKSLAPLLMAIVADCDRVGSHFSWGVMWDFCSLPQVRVVTHAHAAGWSVLCMCACVRVRVTDPKNRQSRVLQRGHTAGVLDGARDDRTPAQLNRFERAVASLHLWYGSAYTHKIFVDTAHGRVSPERHGWCAAHMHDDPRWRADCHHTALHRTAVHCTVSHILQHILHRAAKSG